MKPHAKATSSEPTQGRPSRVARIFRAFATRGASGEDKGTGARPPIRRALHVLAIAPLAAIAIAFALPLVSARASVPPPQFRGEPLQEEVYATRAHIEAYVLLGNTEAPEAKWQGEYAPAEKDGKPPPAESKSWIAAGGGTTFSTPIFIALGAKDDAVGATILHHLTPSTTYYARFHVKDEGGPAEETYEFTTPAVTKSEVAKTLNGPTTFRVEVTGPTSAVAKAQIETNGAQTEYSFEYALPEGGHPPAESSLSWAPFTSGATGTVTVAEDFATPEPKLTGLASETTYYVRLKASNKEGVTVQNEFGEPGGSSSEFESFKTPTARPVVEEPSVRNVTGTSAHLVGGLTTHGSETHWRFEYSTSAFGPWGPVAGAEGTVSQVEAEAQAEGVGLSRSIEGAITGLSPATVYYVRLFAENKAGEAEYCHEETSPGPEYGQIVCEPISIATHGVASFGTAGPPTATTLATHALHGEFLRLLGSVDPHSVPTSEEQTVTIEGAPTGGTFTLTFNGQTTEPIAFKAPADGPVSVHHALGALSTTAAGGVFVTGPDGGPYRVLFGGAMGGVNQPQITADASGLTPSGAVTVAIIQEGGEAYDTHYHVEYVSQKQFEEPGRAGGFAKAASTPEVDLGSGDSTETVGQDLPVLQAGETYRYRIFATNTSPGNPVVRGEEQTLTVPVPANSGAEESCPNQALRTGPSANLPDCRAYEQLTPVDKEGAQEIFRYAGLAVPAYALVGEDGNHFMLEAPVNWGSGPAAGESPYFFSRDPEKGWGTTAATVQPEAGLDEYVPQVFDPGLTRLGLEARSSTLGGAESPNVEFRAGPPGGPYATVATVPHKQAEKTGQGWVAASADFSKLILQVEDHKLVEPQTTTKSGTDLYEYSGGLLRQVNVGIGTCGARIVKGNEETGGGGFSSPHAVSVDGSRAFFEAVPGSNCSEPEHLYVRVNGAETVDLGAYRFAAADSQGTRVLLEKQSGDNPGLYLYETVSPAKFLSSTGLAVGANFTVSEDLKAIYFDASGDISRYDVPTETLSFVVYADQELFRSQVSRDGRYYYFASRVVPGVPGGAVVPGCGQENDHKLEGLCPTKQVYRYDSVEHVIECISCASSFAPEPRLGSTFSTKGSGNGTPKLVFVSANGDFAFFQTPAALISSDVDGEVIPEGTQGTGLEHPETENSVSGDVYEWRRDGVHGCAHVQGCLALITNGRGGYLNLLLGTAEEGRDVFIYTSSQLVGQDNDTAGDIYDVRIGGGFPEPSRPVECEGDACSNPPALPLAQAPATLTLASSGNVAGEMGSPLVAKAKPKPKKKARCTAKPKKKCKAKPKKKTGRKAKRAAQGANTTGRAGR